MITIILLSILLSTVMAQRPTFAGSRPIGVPDVHPMFKKNISQTEPPIQNNLENRFGETGGTTPKIPVDARGDVNLVNRLNQWPQENKPFWLTNYEIIEQHRGGPGGGQSTQSTGFTRPTENGGNQSIGNRFGETSGSGTSHNSNANSNLPEINSNNSFSIIMNGQWRTYVYNPLSDSWIRRA